MKLKNRLAAITAGTAMAVGATFAVAAPAQAATHFLGQTQLDNACANYGAQYKAKSVADNVLGWRCYNTWQPNNGSMYYGIDLQTYCDVTYSGTTAKWYTFSNKWDWRCEG